MIYIVEIGTYIRDFVVLKFRGVEMIIKIGVSWIFDFQKIFIFDYDEDDNEGGFVYLLVLFFFRFRQKIIFDFRFCSGILENNKGIL